MFYVYHKGADPRNHFFIMSTGVINLPAFKQAPITKLRNPNSEFQILNFYNVTPSGFCFSSLVYFYNNDTPSGLIHFEVAANLIPVFLTSGLSDFPAFLTSGLSDFRSF